MKYITYSDLASGRRRMPPQEANGDVMILPLISEIMPG
jgi:hypothetical protein